MSEELKPGGRVPELGKSVIDPVPGEDEYVVPWTPSGPAQYSIPVPRITAEHVQQAHANLTRQETPAPNRHQLTDLRRVARQTRALTALAVILIVFFGFLNMIVK